MNRKPRRSKPNATGRNTTQRFVALPHWMLASAAWRSLTPNATRLLLAVWERHNGANNGEIAFAVREGADIGLSKDQAGRAFAELEAKGFLKVRHKATFSLKTREARTWELTAERCGDKAATKEFMHWRPPCETPSEKQNTVAPARRTVAPARQTPHESNNITSHSRTSATVAGG